MNCTCGLKTLPWDQAGGPEACKHGYAKAIHCPRCCDDSTINARTRQAMVEMGELAPRIQKLEHRVRVILAGDDVSLLQDQVREMEKRVKLLEDVSTPRMDAVFDFVHAMRWAFVVFAFVVGLAASWLKGH